MKDDEKRKLQATVEALKSPSVSEFVRSLLAEKIQVEELAQQKNTSEGLEIPPFIPKGKYVAFINGAVIGVGDSPSEVAQIAAEKFPNFPLIIKFNGSRPKQTEYIYASLSQPHSWKYIQFEDHSYPVVPIKITGNSTEKSLFASIDTAASLCVMQEQAVAASEFDLSRSEEISTAAGIMKAQIFTGTVNLLEHTFTVEFIFAPITTMLPFRFLIGRNLLDQLDAFFFGKKQILMLKMAE